MNFTKTLFTLALTTALASCAAPPWQPLRPPHTTTTAATATQDPAHQTESFRGHDGTPLFEQSWHPTTPARAVVVVHHGLKDYSSRYDFFARRLTSLGYAVYAYDMRGHGRSAGLRATIDSFDDLTQDLGIFMARVRQREPNLPVFLLGHSVGGAVVTLYTLEQHPPLAGLIVLAPALRVDRLPIEAAATPVVGALMPNFGAVDTPDEDFSRSPEIVREMGRDPFVYHSTGPARTAAALIEALGRIWSRADTLDVPLLGLHGTVDRLTDPRGTAELVRRAHHPDHTLLLYRGLRHDLIHEPERLQVMQDIEHWLEAHTPHTTNTPASSS